VRDVEGKKKRDFAFAPSPIRPRIPRRRRNGNLQRSREISFLDGNGEAATYNVSCSLLCEVKILSSALFNMTIEQRDSDGTAPHRRCARDSPIDRRFLADLIPMLVRCTGRHVLRRAKADGR
jgi:hypothetical protein